MDQTRDVCSGGRPVENRTQLFRLRLDPAKENRHQSVSCVVCAMCRRCVVVVVNSAEGFQGGR